MHLVPIHTDRVEVHPKQSLVDWLKEQLEKSEITLAKGDVLVLSSKIVSYFENRIIELESVSPSDEAQRLAKEMKTSPELMQCVLDEADEVVAENPWVLLTRKNGILCANAGVDTSNVPEGHAVLWPTDAFSSAQALRQELMKSCSLSSLAVVIIDSACLPSRKGTVALAIGYDGLNGFQELKNQKDLYENTLRYSALNVVDSIATAANLLMGEAKEQTPIVVVRGVEMAGETKNGEMIISPSEDLYQ